MFKVHSYSVSCKIENGKSSKYDHIPQPHRRPSLFNASRRHSLTPQLPRTRAYLRFTFFLFSPLFIFAQIHKH